MQSPTTEWTLYSLIKDKIQNFNTTGKSFLAAGLPEKKKILSPTAKKIVIIFLENSEILFCSIKR